MKRFTEQLSPSEGNVSFLGISIQPKTLTELTGLVAKMIDKQEKVVIANHNLHSLYLFHRLPQFREFYREARWTHVDGMPIVALARLYGHALNRNHRVTYADWVGPLMQAAAKNQWRAYYVGSRPGIAEAGAEILRHCFPGLQLRTTHGYFGTDRNGPQNEQVLADVDAYKPNILMVGMGMPRQELWIQENMESLCANVILPSGAAMDYIAGAVPTPPRWAGRAGLEWAFRLVAEPGRLWRRYLLEPWSILGVMARDFVNRRFGTRELSPSEE
jgi:N-acetylglucosaminyldiphosphoundecaprenol N-acetyl-beta-D-mannosaminyltransferase